MKRALESAAIVALLSISLTSATRARDHGVVGQTFPIAEPDLLATIEAKLQRLQAEGEIDRMNAAFAKRTEARVRRPKPVAGITPASEARTWAYDPTITIERDVQDQKGNYIARRGQTVNPLDFTAVTQALVFIDGDNDAEMAWATANYSDLKAKIILVNGSPIDEMTQRQRRFYFDQEGRLTGKLGIRHTPAVAIQDGRVMKLSEIKLKGNS
ncbi:type-F conjugative transfer system protein TraW [Sphingomonas sp. BK580]|uniref:type-F conjugative transfer system protein TraW n=1 Tax=Sphingomonas sp. BK580 TaxID=2586972 RepID=UPI00161B9F47|nr:type-F conjugative transfer system protein TraW [Sphingomonas sp. BK580]MBB3694939.1 conjugal transfer pilus assembly protein TraW [Sphingomonas sp. BK580]